ncbi:MAG: DNRLRE domain-containing protein, partial [Planctomycetaceae bacterium]
IKGNATDTYTRKIYLRFDLSAVTGTVKSAKLRMRTSNDAPDGTHDADFVSDDTWGESTITWNNAPASGANLDSQTALGDGDWIVFDVNDQVAAEAAGDGKISFLVYQSVGDDYGQYNSSDVTTWQYKPHLMIEATPPESTVTTLYSTKDTYVRDGAYADTNYGTETTMAIKENATAGYTRRSYVRFDLSSITGTVTDAKLRLYVNRRDASTTHGCNFIGDSWYEGSLTWNNRPATGSRLDTVSVPSAGNWIEFDVTSQVATEAAGDDEISLMIWEPTATTYTLYDTREGTNDPQLVITH